MIFSHSYNFSRALTWSTQDREHFCVGGCLYYTETIPEYRSCISPPSLAIIINQCNTMTDSCVRRHTSGGLSICSTFQNRPIGVTLFVHTAVTSCMYNRRPNLVNGMLPTLPTAIHSGVQIDRRPTADICHQSTYKHFGRNPIPEESILGYHGQTQTRNLNTVRISTSN